MALAALLLTSCATVLGGAKTDHQATRPECGEPRRQIRPGFFAFQLFFFPPGLLIDFATKKIYKPDPRASKLKRCKEAAQ